MQVISAILIAVATLFPVVSTEGAPVKVDECDVAFIDAGGALLTSSLQFTNGVTVQVSNVSGKPITGITINGSYNGFHVTDSWTGTLAAGGKLRIWKHYQQLPYAGPHAKCVVAKVNYADGTTWAPSTSP